LTKGGHEVLLVGRWMCCKQHIHASAMEHGQGIASGGNSLLIQQA
jgi:hypothetical protein